MGPWKWQQILWTAGFLSITYIPLQCVGDLEVPGLARISAALPLLVMVPMLFGALQPLNYDNGSLFGMFFVCPYLPAMIYLSAVSLFGSQLPNACPHCSHQRRVKSLQIAGASTCENCGKDLRTAVDGAR